eukprot:TRINITY_DN5474_c0_g1_i2.p1 TRINITY_DN5474_c0_g1~~TRINITY_DN5474_c0_g1_i2.p1  ORF type:complete len:241 (-),score=19.05 TRINITY_DN5474_c0_g1_i2:13-735(-)
MASVSLVLVALIFGYVGTCIVPGSGNTHYDLSPLEGLRISKADASNEWLYTISVCQNLVECDTSCPQAGYCQFNQRFQNTIFCIGTYSNAHEIEGGVALTYTSIKDGRQGTVIINCDPTATEPTNLEAISPSDKMGYKMIFSSKYACPVQTDCVYPDCDSCAADPSCFYCLDSSSCVPRTSSCTNWVGNPNYCPKCAATTCETCLMKENGCFWCLGDDVCVSSNNNCQGIITNSSYCSLH